jgi:ABC-type multidrug transport system permease subunit
MVNIKDVLRDLGYMLSDVGKFLEKQFWNFIGFVKHFDYNYAISLFKENLQIFLNSKSIYFISIFLPIILTLVVAISVNVDQSVDYDVGYHYDIADKDADMESFFKEIDKDLMIQNYPSDNACLDSVKLKETSFCITFSKDFFKNNNQSDIMTMNIGEKSLHLFDDAFITINSSLVNAIKDSGSTDPITIRKVKIFDKNLAILVFNIMFFFIAFLTLTYASVVYFYRKPKLDDLYANPESYKELILGSFFSCFLLFLIVSLVVFFLIAFSLGLPYVLLWKSLLILVFSLGIFTLTGMLIGSFTRVEDINLFASISVASVMIFLSELIMPNYDPNSILHYLFNINPYHLTTKLLKHSVLFGKGLSAYFYEIMILFVILLLFVTFFVAIYYMLLEKDYSIKNIYNEKSNKAYRDMQRVQKSVPSISTDRLSVSQFQQLEELRRLRRHNDAPIRPSYKKTVNVQVQKNKKVNEFKKTSVETNKEGEFKEDVEAPRGDEYLEELYKQQLESDGETTIRKEVTATTRAKKIKPHTEDEEELLTTVELEGEVLELKQSGKSDADIIKKLKKTYDEEDIRIVLANL